MKIKSEAFPTGMSGRTARITTIHRTAAVLTLQVQQGRRSDRSNLVKTNFFITVAKLSRTSHI